MQTRTWHWFWHATLVALFALYCVACSADPRQRILIAGDSTAATYAAEHAPQTGWGQALPSFIVDEVVVVNHASSGRSTRSFIDEGRWQDVLREVRPGDVVLISFGHNDARDDTPKRYTRADTEYRDNLIRFAKDVLAEEGVPIILSPVARRLWEANTMVETHGLYAINARLAAEAAGVDFVDLSNLSIAYFEYIGRAATKRDFLWLSESDANPRFPDGVEDNTHFSQVGACGVAHVVATALRGIVQTRNVVRTELLDEQRGAGINLRPRSVIRCADVVRHNQVDTKQARPNIIFLLADDQRADSLSVAGHPFVQTPNIDQLAQAGVRYDNAFTAEPICAPSRFAFLSGQYERTSGLGFNSPYEVSEKQWQKTYPALLKDAGYYTGFVGKFGVQYYDFEGGASSKFDYWRGHDGWLPFFPKDLPGNPATRIYRDAHKSIVTEVMGEYAIEFLRSRPQNQPFNLSVSFSAPHNSIVSSMFSGGVDADCESRACEMMGRAANDNPKLQGHEVYDRLYRDADVRMSDDVGADPHQFIPEGILDHDARKQWYAYNYDRSTEPEHLVRYHQTITGIDRVVGALVRELEAQGVADNTVIIYSSDHGLLNGEYGTGGKGLLYDLVARIPLIIYDPRAAPSAAGRVSRELVMSLDVPSTILALGGVLPPPHMQGRVLKWGSGAPPRSEVFLESLTVAEGNPFIEALRTDEWKYVRFLQPGGCPYTEDQLDFRTREPVFEQLFHLAADPAERNNLIAEDRYRSVAQGFRERTALISAELTRESRAFKSATDVPARPAQDVYCW